MAEQPGPWQRELDDFVRAFCGAFLFGMPLLFTMEMWWLGTFIGPWKLLALLALAFAANLGLARSADFRDEPPRTRGRDVEQAIEAVAVGALASTVVLLVLNRIAPDDPLHVAVGRIVVQTVPLSIGASVAHVVFAPGKGREDDARQRRPIGPWQATIRDLGATAAGAIFVGSSIAPTEEVFMLAAQLTYLHQLALIGFSLVLTYAIVFESGFDPARNRPREAGIFQSPLPETVLAYVVSLLVASAAIFLYNRAELADPAPYIVAQVLVLGLPTSIGGAAGRLVI